MSSCLAQCRLRKNGPSQVSGGEIMPVFDTHHFFHPYLTPRFNLTEKMHRTLYEEASYHNDFRLW